MLEPAPVGALGLDLNLKRFKFKFWNQERRLGAKFGLGVLSAASGSTLARRGSDLLVKPGDFRVCAPVGLR